MNSNSQVAKKKKLYRDQIKQLTTVNLQQKAQIDALRQQQSAQVGVLPDQKPHPPQPLQLPPAGKPALINPPVQADVLKQILDRLTKLESPGVGHQQAAVNAGVLTAATAVGSANSQAVAAMGQMADAMAQLSLSFDPSSGSKAGQCLRPEYHYCVLERGMPMKAADASKLSISEYLYGMCLVLEYLIDTDGDWKSYFSHYKRMMKFFIGKKYVNSAYISYDKAVVDSYLKQPRSGFNSSDALSIPTHFCLANEHDTQNTRRGNRRGCGQEAKHKSTSSNPPDDCQRKCVMCSIHRSG